MNAIDTSRRAAVIRALLEGKSVRATARLTGTAKATVLKLLVEIGEFCSIYQDHALRNLKSKRVECDKIWAYCDAKKANATVPGQGDLWTYTAIDSDSKLMLSWLIGPGNHENTRAFLLDVAERLANRVQITTDGLKWYVWAVENAFGWAGPDFAQIINRDGQTQVSMDSTRRYRPAVFTGVQKTWVMGDPDMDKLSIPYAERANLSTRMGMRRSTRLTNGFSKKTENHSHVVSLYFMNYNYCRADQTPTKAVNGIKTTPAMASGLTDHVWTVEEILELMDPNRLLHSNSPNTF